VLSDLATQQHELQEQQQMVQPQRSEVNTGKAYNVLAEILQETGIVGQEIVVEEHPNHDGGDVKSVSPDEANVKVNPSAVANDRGSSATAVAITTVAPATAPSGQGASNSVAVSLTHQHVENNGTVFDNKEDKFSNIATATAVAANSSLEVDNDYRKNLVTLTNVSIFYRWFEHRNYVVNVCT